MKYIFLIENADYETKKVVAEDMGDALGKYKKHLHDHLNPDYSYMAIFTSITSCKRIGEYKEDDMIM